MPYNGLGVFQRVYQWVQDAANGIFVDATRTDTDSNDIATGLTNCVTRDGQSPWTANLPSGGFKITGLPVGSNVGDSINYGQVFNSPAFVTPSATTSPPNGDNSLLLATTAFAQQLAFQTALPAQSLGFLISNGTTASFSVTFTGFAVNEVKGADIASAATINLTTATGNLVHITGTTGITAITIPVGAERTLIFDGILTMTAGGALLLPGGVASIVTAVNDRMIVRGDTAGAVVIGHFPGSATAAEIRTGTNITKTIGAAALLSAHGFSAFFQSANQTITNAGALTIAHGLPRAPVLIEPFLVNLTGEFGYSPGDITPVGPGLNYGGLGKGLAIRSDATNLLVRYSDGGGGANTFYIIAANTGTQQTATNANWALVLRAWA